MPTQQRPSTSLSRQRTSFTQFANQLFINWFSRFSFYLLVISFGLHGRLIHCFGIAWWWLPLMHCFINLIRYLGYYIIYHIIVIGGKLLETVQVYFAAGQFFLSQTEFQITVNNLIYFFSSILIRNLFHTSSVLFTFRNVEIKMSLILIQALFKVRIAFR
ncbi:Hypothetical_protein [Hexamita inflata]|uniref:Hypothetical_protein n=1 Tax=Hexamita inflata TaxID=28002 RepID=A0AA86QRL5_9EUKA|nr:Hypothetical protein HINF_LOCUS47846 [Hexamita inflata]